MCSVEGLYIAKRAGEPAVTGRVARRWSSSHKSKNGGGLRHRYTRNKDRNGLGYKSYVSSWTSGVGFAHGAIGRDFYMESST